MTRIDYKKYLLPLFAIFIVWPFSNYFNSYKKSTPYHYLADLQYTHLAITDNLADGNGHLFSPKSYSLDPNGYKIESLNDGTVDARFPLLHTVVSWFQLSELESKTEVWRGLSFLFFLIAIYFTYLLSYDLSRNWLLSLIISLGVNITSLLLFTQSFVGPYTFTYAVIIAGLYFSYLTFRDNKHRFAILSILFLGIATLQGHSTVLMLSVFSGIRLLSLFKQKIMDRNFFIELLVTLLFLSIFLYNRLVLFSSNGGLFELGTQEVSGILDWAKWNSTFIEIHGSSFSNLFTNILLFSGIFLFGFNYVKKADGFFAEKEFIKMLLLLLVGFLIYYVSNVHGIITSDVYLLENLYPIFVGLSVYFACQIWNQVDVNKWMFHIILMVLLVASSLFIIRPYETKFVKSDDDRIIRTLDNLNEASAFLDSLGVDKQERITLINGYGGNMSLMLANRHGYVANGNTKQDFEGVLKYDDSQFILSQDEYFMFDVVNVYPEVMSQMELVASNEVLSLYKKKKGTPTGSVLKDYVNSHKKTQYLETTSDFESSPVDSLPGTWNIHGEITSEKSANGIHSMKVAPDQAFPCTFQINYEEFQDFKPSAAVVTGNLFSKVELWKMCFTISCHREGAELFNDPYKVSKKLKGNALNKWSRVSCKSTLPDNLLPGDVIKVYLWNPSNGELLLDDFSIVFY